MASVFVGLFVSLVFKWSNWMILFTERRLGRDEGTESVVSVLDMDLWVCHPEGVFCKQLDV